MLDIPLYIESTLGPPWLGPEESFQNGSYQTAGKRYFDFDSCKEQSHAVNLSSRIYGKRDFRIPNPL